MFCLTDTLCILLLLLVLLLLLLLAATTRSSTSTNLYLFMICVSTTAPDYDVSQWLSVKHTMGMPFPNVSTRFSFNSSASMPLTGWEPLIFVRTIAGPISNCIGGYIWPVLCNILKRGLKSCSLKDLIMKRITLYTDTSGCFLVG